MKPVSHDNPTIRAYRQQTAVNPVGTPAVSPSVRQTEEGAEANAARLSISARARDLAAGGVDTAKVESLRKALQSGTLKFDSLAIANKMLSE